MFTHLHNHSEYSLLSGAIRISDLVKRTKELGMKAVALTDYGNIFGAVELATEAKKEGIKPIIGATVFHPSNDDHTLKTHRRGIDQLFQLVLLIQNQTGYINFSRLITHCYMEGFYYKPRLDFKLLAQYSEGLICLSGGWNGPLNHFLYEGQMDKAHEWIAQYKKIFPDRFYIELQENGLEGQHETNLKLVELARSENVPIVATNNCHYLSREDAEAFETLLCIQTGGTLQGSQDHLKFTTDGYFFKSPEEMSADFAYAPEALANTEIIADACQFQFDFKNYYFPKFTPPEGLSLDEYLRLEAQRGFEERWPAILSQNAARHKDGLDEVDLKKRYQDRLQRELEMIQKMGFSGYFLIVSDFISYAKTHGVPVGPGRGSAAGSLVAYSVQITDVDPLQYDLLFERFLNPERISMPDVDIDFCMRGRDQVIKYVNEKYGNVSQIITYGKMKAKAVLRDVGRVMEMPYEEVDKIAKLVPNSLNITLNEALETEPRLQELCDSNPQVDRLMRIAKRLEGLSRHASTHAAGVVISDRPLTDFVPLYKGGNGDIVTQFDMKGIEKIGLIKFDFLGLKTLTIIFDTLKIIKRTRGEDIQILDISMFDEKVFALLSKGDTPGVFQLESSGMKDLLIRMKPSCFEDLIALVALYRPGPLGSGMVDDFINRKQGKTPILYDLPQLKPILQDTYGVIVYQEQVMQIASALGGYSLGEADILRRAMGKKKLEEMIAQRVRFLEGCEKNKMPKEKSAKIFDLMAKFAEYGFNKSHSAAYALVAYQTAYLKAHYLVEYLASILTNESHDTDRVLFYIDDAKAHGIEVLPPDVNEGYTGFSVVGPSQIRYGLSAVKGVGEGAIEAIVEVRQTLGAFKSFYHFCQKVDHHRVNKRVIESLIKCGAFDQLEPRRSALLAAMDTFVAQAIRTQKEEGIGQSNLFSLMAGTDQDPVGINLPNVPPWGEKQKLAYEKEALGFYFSGHPLKAVEAEVRRLSLSNTELARVTPAGQEVEMAGIVVGVKVITTKKGARMAFATFEDLCGSLEVIVFSDVYQKTADLLSQDDPILLKGTIDRTDEGVKILAKEVQSLSTILNQKTQSVHFRVPVQLLTEDKFSQLNSILLNHRGACRGYLHVLNPGHTETVLELEKGVSIDDRDGLKALVDDLFQSKVVDYGFFQQGGR